MSHLRSASAGSVPAFAPGRHRYPSPAQRTSAPGTFRARSLTRTARHSQVNRTPVPRVHRAEQRRGKRCSSRPSRRRGTVSTGGVERRIGNPRVLLPALNRSRTGPRTGAVKPPGQGNRRRPSPPTSTSRGRGPSRRGHAHAAVSIWSACSRFRAARADGSTCRGRGRGPRTGCRGAGLAPPRPATAGPLSSGRDGRVTSWRPRRDERAQSDQDRLARLRRVVDRGSHRHRHGRDEQGALIPEGNVASSGIRLA